ncbi:MAG: flotillin family protein [Pirellulaceae bacterium]
MWQTVTVFLVMMALLILFGAMMMLVKLYRKVEQGRALVVNGWRGTKVSFTGMVVVPVLEKAELMDISVKRIEIYRHGVEGLICRDNIRADIKVVFFVRVNKTAQDVLQVAQLLGCVRGSDSAELIELFDAKFSEALKTVGKQFDFVELYNSRERFKEEILKIIGTDLNGYVLDDAAIDYLEQTPVDKLNPDNILDAEGIKKITDLTAKQMMLANEIRREKEKVLTKQDVEAREAILVLQRQQAEAEEKQQREIAEVKSRERAEADIVAQQQRLRSEQARITTEEELMIAEENKLRQVIVAQKSKVRTEAIETERVEKDRMLEATERERIVTLAQIDKEKAVEQEKKAIQDVIRDRVIVERAVVEEEERIKDTREFASAERTKKVAVTAAEQEAERELVRQIKAAEAAKTAASLLSEERIIKAEAERAATEKETAAKKMFAEAVTAEEAAMGLAEARVMLAKADATEKQGNVDAAVLEKKARAEAQGMSAKAEAIERQGAAEAKVLQMKFAADADGITQKAEAMKLLDGVGREHEEFKLRLNKDKEIELAAIDAQRAIANSQAEVVGAALKSARIDIVGGDDNFFDKIVSSITSAKTVDRLVNGSAVLSDVKASFFNGDPAYFEQKLRQFTGQFGLGTEDIKNLSVAALITRMIAMADSDSAKSELQQLLEMADQAGIAKSIAGTLKLGASV